MENRKNHKELFLGGNPKKSLRIFLKEQIQKKQEKIQKLSLGNPKKITQSPKYFTKKYKIFHKIKFSENIICFSKNQPNLISMNYEVQ